MRKTGVTLLVLVVVSVGLLVADRLVGLGWARAAWNWAVGPLQRGLAGSSEELGRLWERWHKAAELQAENEELKETIEYLTQENRRCQEIVRENEQLRRLLGLQQRYPDLVLLYAEIVGRDPSGLQQTVRVAWSQPEGQRVVVREGMAVIAPAGLVGRILRVFGNSADVLLVTDIESAVSAVVQNPDRPTGLVEGRWQAGSRLRMRFVPLEARVNEGDWVVTSGLQLPPFQENALPAGLPIGQVLQVKRTSDLHQELELIPAVDLDHLERVMIVLGTR
ncbi:MAG: rod shape-determining protein MreC [Chloroflexia bacterium]